jgi:hypothetical protein
MSRGEPQRSKVGRLVAIGKETFTNEQMVQQKSSILQAKDERGLRRSHSRSGVC